MKWGRENNGKKTGERPPLPQVPPVVKAFCTQVVSNVNKCTQASCYCFGRDGTVDNAYDEPGVIDLDLRSSGLLTSQLETLHVCACPRDVKKFATDGTFYNDGTFPLMSDEFDDVSLDDSIDDDIFLNPYYRAPPGSTTSYFCQQGVSVSSLVSESLMASKNTFMSPFGSPKNQEYPTQHACSRHADDFLFASTNHVSMEGSSDPLNQNHVHNLVV